MFIRCLRFVELLLSYYKTRRQIKNEAFYYFGNRAGLVQFQDQFGQSFPGIKEAIIQLVHTPVWDNGLAPPNLNLSRSS